MRKSKELIDSLINGSTDQGNDKDQRSFPILLKRIYSYLFEQQKLTRDRKSVVLNDLIESSSPGVDYFILTILSCIIATFGLLTDSAAVIIGAMLIAPLMSPILGLSMASINGMTDMFRRSLIALLEGAGVAVILSAFIAFISYRLPFGVLATIPNEVLARTSPSPIDLGIALAGGAAASYALAHPRLSAALPGVAIATALMPPLCTIVIGIAFWNSSIIFGALILFITNLIAISFAGIITFAAMGFGPRNLDESEHISRSLSISFFLVLAIGLLLAVLAWNTITEARFYNEASTAIIESVNKYTTASLVDLSITTESGTKKLVVTLRTSSNLNHVESVALQKEISEKLNTPIGLELITIPMQILDPQSTLTPTPTMTSTPYVEPTNTPTPVSSLTPSATVEPTATPAPAFIESDKGQGADIYDDTGKALLFHLPEESAVWVFTQNQQTINRTVWIEIRDMFYRTGWVKADELDISLPIP
jgi:uncharacterized hydrophobic protein (TIGR00271 family)